MIHDEATSSNEAHAKFKKVQQGVENEGYYFSKKERKKSRLTHQSLYFNFKLVPSYVSFQIRFVFLKFRTKDFLNM